MSIYGALNTAVSGLSAQAHAFTDLSNNISNSQTVGYKATDTNFSDYVLTSGAAEGTAGTVIATTASENEAQGTISASDNALALAISGRGFFSVDEESGTATTSVPAFQTTAYYTRNGDFTENKTGYLVNSSNEYLNGYNVDSSGTLSTTLAPINVSNVAFRPTETGTVTLAASLPNAASATTDDATAAAAMTQTQTVYDSTGAAHTLDLTWSYTGTDASTTDTTSGDPQYTVSSTLDGVAQTNGGATVTFDSTTGLLASVAQTDATGNTTTTAVTGAAAGFSIPATFNGVSQPISIALGSIGAATGTTMATTSAAVPDGAAATISTDSVTTSGTYTGITMTSDGNIMANFSNNQTQLVGKVPLAMFADANALAATDGEAYTATSGSGAATITLANENGAGSLETSSVEDSTTNLDTDLTKLIVAQQAYGANAKVVTTANEMLQTVLSMKQ